MGLGSEQSCILKDVRLDVCGVPILKHRSWKMNFGIMKALFIKEIELRVLTVSPQVH